MVIYLIVYVDDIVVTGPSLTHLNNFITSLSYRFSLKDLGNLSYFLSIEVASAPAGLFLNQTSYVNDLLTQYNMSEAKPVSTPMVAEPPLTANAGSPISNPTDYRAIPGSLQYLSFTRSDVAFSINKLSQYVQNPKECHWYALKRLLQYLK